jgi:hypothetical protein
MSNYRRPDREAHAPSRRKNPCHPWFPFSKKSISETSSANFRIIGVGVALDIGHCFGAIGQRKFAA